MDSLILNERDGKMLACSVLLKALSVICASVVGVTSAALAVSAGAEDYGIAPAAEYNTFLPDEIMANYRQTVYNIENGLSTSEANTAIQTSDGYIWIGSYGGLYRFDGKNFWPLNDPSGVFTPANINVLFEDSENKLWIGTNDKGIYSYDKSEFVSYETSANGQNSVYDVVQTDNGIIYSSVNGVFSINSEGVSKFISFDYMSDNTIKDLDVDSKGNVWGVLSDGNVICFSSDGKNLISYLPQSQTGIFAYSVLVDSNDNIYIGSSENEVAVLNSSYEVDKTFTLDKLTSINSMYEDSQGIIWACSDDGLAVLNHSKSPDGPVEITSQLLVHQSIEGIFEDYEGGMWLCSSRMGVLRMTRTDFKNYSNMLGIYDDVINTVSVYKNDIYVGTDSGLYVKTENALLDQTDFGMPENLRVRCTFVDSKDNLWICTYSGLIKYDGNEAIIFNIENSNLVSERFRTVTEDSDGRIIAGTDRGIAIIENDVCTKFLTSEDGLENPFILTLYADENGTTYVGSNGKGIYLLNGYSITPYLHNGGFESGIMLRITDDINSDGFFVCSSNNIYYCTADSVKHISTFGQTTGSLFDILFPSEEKVWVLAANGVMEISYSELINDNCVNIKNINKDSGITMSVTANSFNFFDKKTNTAYICGNDSIYAASSGEVLSSNEQIKFAINGVYVDGVSVSLNNAHQSKITLENDAKRISIMYSLLSFSNKEYRVTYYLDGFENPITISSSDISQISYTNLKGGKYTLKISAVDSMGNKLSDEIEIEIVKKKTLTETTTFWVILVILLIGFAILAFLCIYNIKTRNIRKRQEEYRQITKQSLHAIANTIDAKDPYTNGHSKRVAEYSAEIARRLDMSEEDVGNIYYSGLLHDIGKIAVPSKILNKPTGLTPDERKLVCIHPVKGAEILADITTIPYIQDGARYHHERYDGEGYCAGLSGDDIPIVARIIGVADAYDAMHSNRPYRSRRDLEYIINELEIGKGKQFDPIIAEIMIQIAKELDNL